MSSILPVACGTTRPHRLFNATPQAARCPPKPISRQAKLLSTSWFPLSSYERSDRFLTVARFGSNESPLAKFPPPKLAPLEIVGGNAAGAAAVKIPLPAPVTEPEDMDVEERPATKSAFLSEAGPRPIDKYMYLRDLREHDTTKYYQLMLNNAQQVLPFIYTPTVGQACQEYHSLGIKTRGLYLSLNDRGSILSKLRSWPQQDIQVIVVTDGERILGLGDLGANGMGISEGKIELYTAAAGVDPSKCLPIALDVGTNNVKLRESLEYKGLRSARPSDEEYDAFVDEFMQALKVWRPHVLLQYEDFGNHNAFRVLEKYQSEFCCFNDDIQGTAGITLAALLGALRIRGGRLSEQRILFLGAGEAACGIATLISYCMHRREGLSEESSRQRCYLMDSKGLVVASRTDLQHHKKPFAHDAPSVRTLIEAVRMLKPTAIIGVSAVPNTFDEEVIKLMAELNERPIIFPLSNPTSLSECTFEQAVKWTDGRVIFASGSPFDPIEYKGELHNAPQANNAYIFPAVGHAAVLTKAKTIPQAVFLVAAEQLAAMATIKELQTGSVFPQFSNIRSISAAIMAAVVRYLVNTGLGTVPAGWEGHDTGEGLDWRHMASAAMWSPHSSSRL